MANSKPLEQNLTVDQDDPWELVDPPKVGKDWNEKTHMERLTTVLTILLKVTLLIALLYMFICSLDFLSNAFRLLGGKAAGDAFRENTILSNPISNLVIGVLATVLLQSSSTTTSIVVTMVAAEILDVRPAIFMIMGANIGTSVTNTIVSIGHAGNRNEFRRAFAGATVHDMFNWLAVVCLLPIEWISGTAGAWQGCGLLCQFTGYLVSSLNPETNKNAKQDILKVITKPFTSLIIQIDKKLLNKFVTLNATEAAKYDKSLIKHECSADGLIPFAVQQGDTCAIEYRSGVVKTKCVFMFEYIATQWSDAAVGICLLILALFLLCVCLILIVKLLHSLLQGRLAIIIKKFVNSDFPGCGRYFTGYLAILLGAGMTMILQSSSVFTSALTPLVGVGVLHLERMYPLTLGANIGTTFTAILAALASDISKLHVTLQVALCHLFFNIFGIMIWYPVPYMRKVPVKLAKFLGNTTAKYRWFALVYLLGMFFVFPGIVFGLSVSGDAVLLGVGIPVLLFIIVISIMNSIQSKRPQWLPAKLRTWEFLPKALRSLEPYDRIFIMMKCCKTKKAAVDDDPTSGAEVRELEGENNGRINLGFETEKSASFNGSAVIKL